MIRLKRDIRSVQGVFVLSFPELRGSPAAQQLPPPAPAGAGAACP